MNLKTLDIAEAWVSMGYSIIPITYHSKRPAFDALRMTGSVQDGEITWSPFKQRLATAEELKVWFTGPKRNLGIVTGHHSLVVLDFDDRDIYTAWQGWAQDAGGIAAEIATKSYRVMSSRGVHVYVTVDEEIASYKVSGVDIKARYGYVLSSPSIHPSGSEYLGIGHDILRCAHLCDVFPLSRPEVVANIPDAVMINDPWEAATQAIECGGMGSVERIKASLRVEALLPVPGKAKRFMTICPAHRDTNPSLSVDLVKQTVYCFGCGFHGDVIALYAAMHQLSNREAISVLAQS